MAGWKAYNELAWLEPILAPPEKYVEETEVYCKAILEHSRIKPVTMLHLGCGAGINDYTFKRYFKVTGIDISKGMLEVAKKINPEVEYIEGDMRNVQLNRKFDVVAIPDSSGYMTNLEDLAKAFRTASGHLNEGGILFVLAHVKEEFVENNFVYSGEKDNVKVTVFENNFLIGPENNSYEATIVYLVRTGNHLQIYSESHLIGLFESSVWYKLFKEQGFEVKDKLLPHLYDQYMAADGKYPLRMFVGMKR